MLTNIAALDSSFTLDKLTAAANSFERIANAEPAEWLPAYYAAYALVMKAFMGADVKDIDALCNKADELLAKAESLSPDNSEITTLKAMALTARIQVDGSRGMTLGPKASAMLQQALQQQPANNPRAYVQLGQMMYYTPEAFGGGKKAGLQLVEKGLQAYETFVPASNIAPNWGKPYALQLQQQWSK
ncbi:MAG TPA: hypothetical protein PKD90_17005, partial [Phnomibacter sp.]|nr:hypothetical protein [Phnomibacter sp.]